RFVAFESRAANLVAGDTNGTYDIFVRDRLAGVTECISVNPRGVSGDRDSLAPRISSDGRYVAFASDATDLVAADTNRRTDVFLRDRMTGRTTLVSTDSSGNQGNGVSGNAKGLPGVSISAQGRFVAFTSEATNLVPGDTKGHVDIFVHDVKTGVTECVSLTS